MAGPNICAFYMPQKKRGCRQIALPMKLYCGNHDPGSTTDHAQPYYRLDVNAGSDDDEAGMDSAASNPFAKGTAARRAQPYYRLDVNAGSDDDEADMGSAASNPFAKGTAARRLAYALSLGESVFEALLVKVESSHAKVCSSSTPLSVRIPEKLEEKLAEGARMQPTQPPAADSTGDAQMQPTQLPASDSTGTCNGTAQEGPAVQQVQAACNGIAQEGPAVQQVQAACNGIAQEGPVVQPATKHLRQQASIIGNMQSVGLLPLPPSGMVVEMGAGKGGLGALMVSHAGVQRLVLNDIRGASFRNKLSLHCTPGVRNDVREASFRYKADKWLREIELHRVKADLKDFYLPGTPGTMTPDFALRSVLVMNSRPGAEEGAERSADDDKEVERVKASVLGLAIARCGWRAYVGKALFRELGFTPKEFHLVSYMTGWALCGHNAPAGCVADSRGWALCGHNAPAGCGADTTAGEGEAEFSDEDVEHEEEVDCGRKHKKMKHKEDSSGTKTEAQLD
eukprot:gene22586-29721_t